MYYHSSISTIRVNLPELIFQNTIKYPTNYPFQYQIDLNNWKSINHLIGLNYPFQYGPVDGHKLYDYQPSYQLIGTVMTCQLFQLWSNIISYFMTIQ